MRQWDLSGGAARLDLAWDTLTKSIAEIAEQWNDPAFQAIQDNYVAPLEPRLMRALEAIKRLEEVLSRAEQDCRSE